MARTMLLHSDFPAEFWVDASYTTTSTINSFPSSVLGGVSPFEKLFHHPPSYHFLKTFGCAYFPLILDSKLNKLQPKSKKCVFIGYVVDYKSYQCYDPVTNKVYIRRHVFFHEHEFSYRSLVGSSSHVPYTSPSVLIVDWSPTNVSCASSHPFKSVVLSPSSPIKAHSHCHRLSVALHIMPRVNRDLC